MRSTANESDYFREREMRVKVSGPLFTLRAIAGSNVDVNMPVIRGNKRVADIYFGEFMRIFDHHYVRDVVRKPEREGEQDPNAGYLKSEPRDGCRHTSGRTRTRRREGAVS